MAGKFWWERTDEQILENRVEALEQKVRQLEELHRESLDAPVDHPRLEDLGRDG